MIQFFKSSYNKLIEVESIEKDGWINVVSPTLQEIEMLSGQLLVPPEVFSDPLDPDENSRVESHKNALLIVCRIPCENGYESHLPYSTVALGILLKRDLIVTVCSRPTEVIQLFKEGKVKHFFTANRERFVMQIFYRSSLLFLKYLKYINNKADEIEMMLHRSTRNRELLDLLKLEKSLVFFSTSLKSNELMMQRLQRNHLYELTKETERELIEDVSIETSQAIEMAKIYSNILGNMMGAHSSIISNNLNITIRYLTTVTIILTLPIMVASIYGMNVPLPFQNNPHAFWIVTMIALLLSLLGVFFFRKKNLF
ncbi:MAG: magnesium transporter CorA family protein [Bacteroidia bacterium]|nr:magnesium transporter CorA family protein [Bacteroidia bacterium]